MNFITRKNLFEVTKADENDITRTLSEIKSIPNLPQNDFRDTRELILGKSLFCIKFEFLLNKMYQKLFYLKKS